MKGSEDSQKPGGDDALEARIVAWVLGEASPFEAAEVEKLCAEDPKLRDFERRMRDLNEILVADAKPGLHAAWKLPAGKREKVTDLLGVVEDGAAEGKVNRYFARRILLAAAACVAISLVSYPLFSGGRKEARVAMAPEKAVDFMPATSMPGRGESLSKEAQVEKLRRAVAEQEDLVEDKRKELSLMIRSGRQADTRSRTFAVGDGPEEVTQNYAALEQEKTQLENQIETLLKYDGTQLMSYASGLNLPDNVIPELLPRYQEQKREYDALKSSGLAANHPSLVEKEKTLKAMESDLGEAAAGLRGKLKAKLDKSKQQLAGLEAEMNLKRDSAIGTGVASPGFSDLQSDFDEKRRQLEEMKRQLAEHEGEAKLSEQATALNDSPVPAAPADVPAEPEMLAKKDAAGARETLGGRVLLTEDQLAQLGAPQESDDLSALPSIGRPEGGLTGGVRRGEGSINRNDIDAIVDNPSGTPVPGQRSIVAGVELQLPAEQIAGAVAGNEPAMVLRDEDPSVSRFSLGEIVPRKPGEMPIQDSRARDGFAMGDRAGSDRMAWDVNGAFNANSSSQAAWFGMVAGDPVANPFAGGTRGGEGDGSALAAAEKFFFGRSTSDASGFGFMEGDRGTEEPRQLALGGELYYKDASQITGGPLVAPAMPLQLGQQSDKSVAERGKGQYVPNVDQVRRSLYQAEGAYNLGKYDDAARAYEDVIRADPFNQAARRGMEQVAQAKTDYYRTAYDHTRAELLSQVDAAWELQVPEILQAHPAGEAKAGGGLSALAEKEVARRQTTVEEADRFVEEGAKARESGDLGKAYKMHVDGLGLLPEAPAVDARRAEVKRSLGEIAAGLAADAKARGNQDAAKEWAGKALQWNPEQREAKQILDLGGADETSTVAEPFSTFSLHVSDASFKLAKAGLDRGEQPDPAGIRTEEFYNAFDYGDPAPAQGEPVVCVTEQSAHPILPQRNLVRIGVRTAAAGRGGSTPLNLTLLLDSSGSMEREDRQAAMLRAVEQLSGLLKEGDTITVAGFARQPRLLADRLPGARAQELNRIIAQTPSEGGTNLEEGLKLAEELAKRQFNAAAQNRIVLFTDGAANLGDAQPESLQTRVEQLRQQGIAFDAAGFGAEGLNDRLLERLTRNGNGRYYVVDRAEDAGESFAKQLAGAFRPAAENVKVQVRFNPARVGRYKLIGFEEHRLAKEDFKNDAVDAAEMAAEEAGNALYQVQPIPGGEGEIGEVSVRFRDVASGQMVERTWTIPYQAQVPAFDQAAPSMQLAGLAMFAAEKLGQGPMAEAIDFGQLGKVLAPVKARYAGSAAVDDLEGMIEKLK
jgi:Mg-chelatase subunit ChlD